jgi:uncharacterized damage-inducible protein DinB
MSGSLMDEAFAHHIWATLRLIDACLPLSPEQLEAGAAGTYGSVLSTLRHIVESDSFDLSVVSDEKIAEVDEDSIGLAELRTVTVDAGAAWSRLLATDPDPGAVLLEKDDDFERLASIGIRLAQALDHGSEHRSQVCTILTSMGVQPPKIDVFDFGLENGTVTEKYSDSPGGGS